MEHLSINRIPSLSHSGNLLHIIHQLVFCDKLIKVMLMHLLIEFTEVKILH